MRFLLRSIPILLIASTVGCASVGVRMGAYDGRTAIYPATVKDASAVSYLVTRPFVSLLDPTISSDGQGALVYLFAPLAIVDFPLAVAVDTLFLPYDIYRIWSPKVDHESHDKLAPTKSGSVSDPLQMFSESDGVTDE